MSRPLALVALVLALLVPGISSAWHKDGHMAVARIASQQLEKDKEVRDKLIKILKAHVQSSGLEDPATFDHYTIFLAADRPGYASTSFALSAI